MRLRELQIKDADKMYQWMSDDEVVSSLLIGRFPTSIEKIYEFIRNSWTDKVNVHFAVVDDTDDYVGTVSLKQINYIDRNAEYAIALCKEYWGQNYARFATDKIIEYGFKKLNLHKIYFNVVSTNIRANKFYKKYGFELEGQFREHLYIEGNLVDLNWYCKLNIR